jgi:hypothetical protein
MKLLDDELRQKLPPLNSQEAENDPFVYAKFFLPGTDAAWYVIEGQAAGDEFVFYGFVTQSVSQFEFGEFQLSELEAIRGPHGARVERDPDFTPGRLTDVVPAPEL